MGQIIGLDTPVFIYLLEEHPRYLKRVEHILHEVQQGKTQAVFSCIGLIEILTGPKKQGRYDLAAHYRDILAHFPHLAVKGIDGPIVEIASDLRARYGIATPDAIHIATAMESGASQFVTNDKYLVRVKEIPIKLL